MRLLVTLITTLSLLYGQTSQPLVIVVRDGQGHPLPGVTLRLLLSGPPPEPFDNCVTDSAGQCRLMLPPGAYIVQFEGGWRGETFVPADQQNSGGLEYGGASGGGFGVYPEPSNVEQVVTFVVGRRDGQLVPLWDMSRDASAPPQPFAVADNPFDPSADPLAGIDLGALVSSGTPGGEEGQIVQSTVSAGGTSTPIRTSTPTALPNGRIPADGIWLGTVGLIAAAVLVAVIVLIVTRMRRKGING